MTIVLTGGGSGGHITPLQAIATELKRQKPSVHLIYIGQRGDSLADIPAADSSIDEVFLVRAGKFRRYHGEGLRQLLDVSTFLKNARDAVYVAIGLWQSRRLLKRVRPAVIFIKGGFIGVPVGLAAASLHLPYITHDSDATAGLANRIIARWASLHAVSLPAEVYGYPKDKTLTTGIPLQADFVPVTGQLKAAYRREINMPDKAQLLFVIGGGLGAQRVNAAVAEAMPHLLHEFPNLYVVHGAGRANQAAIGQNYNQILTPGEQDRVQVFGYLSDVYRYSGAADVIITRAGATNLAEFAVQGKACVVVPSPFLAGGHQLKNAQALANKHAAVVISETDLTDDPNRLAKQVSQLLQSPAERRKLGQQLALLAKPQATKELAAVILEQASKQTQP